MKGLIIDIFYYGAVVYIDSSNIMSFSSFSNVFEAGATFSDGTQFCNTSSTYLSTNPIQTQIMKWGLKVGSSHTNLMDWIELDEKDGEYHITSLNDKKLDKQVRVYRCPESGRLAVGTSDKLIFMKNKEHTELLCAMAVDRDGLWRVYGGHNENKESTVQGANREADEEGFTIASTRRLKEFEVIRIIPAEVQESRRGWALKFIRKASSLQSVKDLIWEHLWRLENNPNTSEELHKKITSICSQYLKDKVTTVISIPIASNYQCKFMVLPDAEIYRIVGTIPEDDSPTMKCGASYTLYEYDEVELNKVFKPKDKSEQLLGRYLTRDQINYIIEHNLLRWDSHAVPITEGYSFFNRYLSRVRSADTKFNASLFPNGEYKGWIIIR